MLENELYEQTVKRLARGGIKDPTSQIIALAKEIEMYRDKIYGLEAMLKASRSGDINSRILSGAGLPPLTNTDDHNPVKGKPEYHGITWFPELGHGRELAKVLTELQREGYVPDMFSFDPRTETDFCCIGFRMVKL